MATPRATLHPIRYNNEGEYNDKIYFRKAGVDPNDPESGGGAVRRENTGGLLGGMGSRSSALLGGTAEDEDLFTEELFLYWDGRDRWIISPMLGASIHEARFVGGPWAFSTDAVVTPDMIDEPFSVVEPEVGWSFSS